MKLCPLLQTEIVIFFPLLMTNIVTISHYFRHSVLFAPLPARRGGGGHTICQSHLFIHSFNTLVSRLSHSWAKPHIESCCLTEWWILSRTCFCLVQKEIVILFPLLHKYDKESPEWHFSLYSTRYTCYSLWQFICISSLSHLFTNNLICLEVSYV